MKSLIGIKFIVLEGKMKINSLILFYLCQVFKVSEASKSLAEIDIL
jgi:hypothetical protein